MTVYFSNVGTMRFVLKRTIECALAYLGQPRRDLEMSVSVVSEQEIRKLNKEFRNTDAVTDVLSFPTIDNPERKILNISDFSADAVNQATGKLNIGDVIICAARARQQAQEYGHSLRREMCFLTLHGLLHLLGYDHVDSADERIMSELQQKILDKLHITRE